MFDDGPPPTGQRWCNNGVALNHQDYYKKNPIRFKFYKYRCGREQRLEELWGRSSSR